MTTQRNLVRIASLGLVGLVMLGTARNAAAQGGFLGQVSRGVSEFDPNKRGSGMNRALNNFDRGTLPYRQELGNRGVNIADDYARARLGLPPGQGGSVRPNNPPSYPQPRPGYPQPRPGYPPPQPNYQQQRQLQQQQQQFLSRELQRQREFEMRRWQQQQNFQMQQLRAQQQIARQQAEAARTNAIVGTVGQIIGGAVQGMQGQGGYAPAPYGGYQPAPYGGYPAYRSPY